MRISNKRKRRINANDGNWCIQIYNIISFHIYTNIKLYEFVYDFLITFQYINISNLSMFYIIDVSYDFYY